MTEASFTCFLDCRLLPPALAEGHVADMPTSVSMLAHHTDPWWASCRYIADMTIALLQDRLARLVLTDPAEDHFEDPQMLPPMFLGNDAGKSHCMTGTDFQKRVLQHPVGVPPHPSIHQVHASAFVSGCNL